MAQAVSCRPTTAEARVRSGVNSYGICGGRSGTGTGFSPSTSIFTCQFHSTGAPLLGKGHKIIIFIFITGLHKKTQGCDAPVASAAGPISTQKKNAHNVMCITFIATTCFGVQNTIFREHVMPSLKPFVRRRATYSWFDSQKAALVMSSYKTYMNLTLTEIKH
jgi:hypothetical protein